MSKFRAIFFMTTALAAAAPSLAQAQNFSNLDIGPFAKQEFEVATATDKKTKLKMTIVKMKDGHMMVLTPAEAYMMLLGMAGSPNTNQ